MSMVLGADSAKKSSAPGQVLAFPPVFRACALKSHKRNLHIVEGQLKREFVQFVRVEKRGSEICLGPFPGVEILARDLAVTIGRDRQPQKIQLRLDQTAVALPGTLIGFLGVSATAVRRLSLPAAR